jgi:hypothetical protein
MSTELLAREDVYLTRFYGGRSRGRCYQITVRKPYDKYVELTEDQMRAVVEAYTRSLSASTLPDWHEAP